MESLDPYQRPPEHIRNIYKRYQKMKLQDLDRDGDIVDLEKDLSGLQKRKVSVISEVEPGKLNDAFGKFAGSGRGAHQEKELEVDYVQDPVRVYECRDMPGLHIIPNLLPPEIQLILLSRLLHRDLSTPSHLTNIHTHYTLDYPPSNSNSSSNPSSTSFFTIPPTTPTPVAHPLDPSIHRPLSISQLLNKKMRWMTLGGQYDWTAKQYPHSPPPHFPPDIAALLNDVFPHTNPEAAIVNLYSPGDTLSVHRDVAEQSRTGLVSVSLGCDAVFVVGSGSGKSDDNGRPEGEEEEDKVLVLRLRSGSAVYMSGESRFAWHGVPQIVPGTCPDYLKDWPAGGDGGEGGFEEWRGWMAGKRVNLNVRQMWDT